MESTVADNHVNHGRVLIAGAGGFIGGHLARELLERGDDVRVVDIKPVDSWYQLHSDAENLQLDLTGLSACKTAMQGIDWVFNLACDMGGMGFIESHRADCMLSVLINTHLLMAARDVGVERFLYTSSACVYADHKQNTTAGTELSEGDAYPAMPEDGYGWEKLFSERMCRHFREDYGIETRVARYHNVYGPNGAYDDGREKAPAAICRKVAQAVINGSSEIEVWGDGEQTRSFIYIDDCLTGTLKVAESSDFHEPINLGSSELVSINRLVEIVQGIAGIELERIHDLSAPQGVRGRNSDNTLIRKTFGWEPSTPLEVGLRPTYEWIHTQLVERTRGLQDATT